MHFDGEQVCPGCESRRIEREIEKDLTIIRGVGRQGAPGDRARRDVVAQYFKPVEIDDRSVIALEMKREIGDGARIVDCKWMTIVGGNPLIVGIAAV